MSHLLGYAGVSTADQNSDLQLDALHAVGCYRVFADTASGALDDRQELSMLSLHLLQISLVYVNTLMIQQVLGQDRWANAMSPDDLTICAQVRSCTAT